MKNSTSKAELTKFNKNLSKRYRNRLRIADFCASMLLLHDNYGMNCRQLMEAALKAGWRTKSKQPNQTISAIVRVKNRGLFRKPRNGKFKLRESVFEKLVVIGDKVVDKFTPKSRNRK